MMITRVIPLHTVFPAQCSMSAASAGQFLVMATCQCPAMTFALAMGTFTPYLKQSHIMLLKKVSLCLDPRVDVKNEAVRCVEAR